MLIKSMEIEFGFGTISDCMDELYDTREKHDGCIVFGNFNGHRIDSTMSKDEAYISITGKTQQQLEEDERKWRDDYEKAEQEHKSKIPELSKEWIERAKGIIREEKYEYWCEIVPIRLGDLYRGMELGCTLDLVKMLDIDKLTLEDAKKVFYEQGHSGMSAGLMFEMMKVFCSRGNEFVEYVR